MHTITLPYSDVPEHFETEPFSPITLGNLTVRIASCPEDVLHAQKLRYAVFCDEMGAAATPEVQAQQRDFDEFDTICDHMLVEWTETQGASPIIVGTYRLLRGEVMPRIGRFYTESEFDISRLKTQNLKLLELGRSCVRSDFRNKAVMQLLWRGIGEYVTHYGIELMFGCASFAGADVDLHKECLAYLHHFHRAPDDIAPVSLPHLYVDMNLMEKDAINQKKAFAQLPVLIKGYLRLGGFIGHGAMIDHAFNTTDVSIVVHTSNVGDKYVSRYAPDITRDERP